MSNNLKPTLARLAAGEALSDADAEAAFDIIMSGEATPAQIGALLMAMRLRGETVAEITGAVRAMRGRMTAIEAPAGAIDVCGTGGDGAGTLNVSSAVTFVVAGCGVPVAKHGNRALSSRTGGADVLTALGVNVDAPLERLSGILLEAGCVFLFAPRHHPAQYAVHRREPRPLLGRSRSTDQFPRLPGLLRLGPKSGAYAGGAAASRSLPRAAGYLYAAA